MSVALVAVLLSAGLSACGGSGSTSGPSSGVASSSSASSSTVPQSTKSTTLSWSPPTQNSDGIPLSLCASGGASGSCLAGHTLHYGSSSQNYTGEIQITDPTATSYVVSDANFPAGTYYFAISAYNGLQSSSPMSGEVEVILD